MKKGIITFTSFVLIIALMILGISIVLTAVLPTIERIRVSSTIENAIQQMKVLDSLITQVAGESIGSKRVFNLRVGEGEFFVNNKSGGFEFSLRPRYSPFESGMFFSIENMYYSTGVPEISNWKYRKPITIIEQSRTTLKDYQVLVVLDTASLVAERKMRSDCGDIRFIDSNGTQLNYWLEAGCNTSSTKIWVRFPEIRAQSTGTIFVYYGNSDAISSSNKSLTLDLFQSNFSTDPNEDGNWEIYRYSNSLSDECFWNSTEGVFYLTKAVGGRGCMAFVNVTGYPLEVSFEFKAGGGSGADGMAFAFNKNITAYQASGVASGGGSLALASSVAGDSDGYALELDNYDNGINDPSGNYIATARTNNWDGGWVRPEDNFHTTAATEDYLWHSIFLKIAGDYSKIISAKLDGDVMSNLTDIEISKLNFGHFGFGAATGGLNNEHVIDNVTIYYRKYVNLEPTVTIGTEETKTHLHLFFYYKNIKLVGTEVFSAGEHAICIRKIAEDMANRLSYVEVKSC